MDQARQKLNVLESVNWAVSMANLGAVRLVSSDAVVSYKGGKIVPELVAEFTERQAAAYFVALHMEHVPAMVSALARLEKLARLVQARAKAATAATVAEDLEFLGGEAGLALSQL